MRSTEEGVMPAVFVLDLKGGRSWEKMIPGATESNWLPADAPDSGTIDPEPAAGDILIFHEEGGSVKRAAQILAHKGVWVIAVSLSGGDGAETGTFFYRRRRGVEKPTDDHFKACFGHFLKRLAETRVPYWQLLEGPPPPDALLAYYLLGLLAEDPAAMKARAELRASALDEAETIVGASETPELTAVDIDDHGKLRDFLAKSL